MILPILITAIGVMLLAGVVKDYIILQGFIKAYKDSIRVNFTTCEDRYLELCKTFGQEPLEDPSISMMRDHIKTMIAENDAK